MSSCKPAFAGVPDAPAEPFLYEHHGPAGVEGTLRILPVRHTRALRVGLELMDRDPVVLLGMSPGNGYFTRKRVEIAVCGLARRFGRVTVVIPDSITSHTYRALGYGEKECRDKAKRNALNLRNRCARAVERARADTPSTELRVLDWEADVATLPGFWDAHAKVSGLMETDPRFRHDVLSLGKYVLGPKLGEAIVTEAALRESSEYLLKEFAFLSVCREALGRDVVVPYHKDFPLGHDFCDGAYGEPLPGVGWLIYDIDVFDDAAAAPAGGFADELSGDRTDLGGAYAG